MERIWRSEGLKVPAKQPKKGRLWLNEGSCIRPRPERRDHVWACDFVEDQTHDGRKVWMLDIVDGPTRECLSPPRMSSCSSLQHSARQALSIATHDRVEVHPIEDRRPAPPFSLALAMDDIFAERWTMATPDPNVHRRTRSSP